MSPERASDMGELVRVASLSELRSAGRQVAEVGGRKIALFTVGRAVYALDNTCPHAGFPLGDGDTDGEWVICPGHSFYYNLKTGQCRNDPGMSATRLEVVVDGDDVKVRI